MLGETPAIDVEHKDLVMVAGTVVVDMEEEVVAEEVEEAGVEAEVGEDAVDVVTEEEGLVEVDEVATTDKR